MPLDPARMREERKRVEKALRQREKEEAAEARQAIDGSELRRIEREIADVRKMKIGVAAKDAALSALNAEREALEATAKRGMTGTGTARKMLALLPAFAKDFERQLEKAFGKHASQSEIEAARAATSDLIEGGKIYWKAGKEATEARVSFLGLGGHVLQVAKARRIGSGGRIFDLFAVYSQGQEVMI